MKKAKAIFNSICSVAITLFVIFVLAKEYINYEKNAVRDLINGNPFLSKFDVNKMDKLSCKGITYLGYKGQESGTFTVTGSLFSDGEVKFNFFTFPKSCDEKPVEENPLQELADTVKKVDSEMKELDDDFAVKFNDDDELTPEQLALKYGGTDTRDAERAYWESQGETVDW